MLLLLLLRRRRQLLLLPHWCTWLVPGVSDQGEVRQVRTAQMLHRCCTARCCTVLLFCMLQMYAAHHKSILGDLGHPTHPRAWIGLTAVGNLTEFSNLHDHIKQGFQRQNNAARGAVLCDMVNYMLTCRALSSSPKSTGRSRGDTFSVSTVSFSPLS